MKYPLIIETHDKMVGFNIAAIENSLTAGTIVEAPGNIKIEYQGSYIQKAFGIPEILNFVVEASVTVDLSLFATWLYSKVKDSPVEKIIIHRKEITVITESNIRKVLEEEIKFNE